MGKIAYITSEVQSKEVLRSVELFEEGKYVETISLIKKVLKGLDNSNDDEKLCLIVLMLSYRKVNNHLLEYMIYCTFLSHGYDDKKIDIYYDHFEKKAISNINRIVTIFGLLILISIPLINYELRFSNSYRILLLGVCIHVLLDYFTSKTLGIIIFLGFKKTMIKLLRKRN